MSTAVANEKETAVSLSEKAAAELKDMLAKDPQLAGKGLRVFVEAGGCSGMSYGMTFDEVRPGDQVGHYGEVKVLVDEMSAEYVRGSVIDFSDALTGGGFKITNPNAKTSCGCGKSFEA